ncbi:hypothetical protein SDIAM26S_01766 [Streptomyces diastaticus subsp. diastaticus]
MVHQRRGSVSPAGCECRGVSVPWGESGDVVVQAGWAAYRSTGSGSRRRFLRALHDDSLFPDRALDKGAAILTAPRERIGARGRPASTPSTHSPTPRQRRSTRWRPGPRSGRQRDRDHRPRGDRRGVPAHRDGSRLPGRGPRTPRQRPGLVTAEAGGPAGLREAGVSHRGGLPPPGPVGRRRRSVRAGAARRARRSPGGGAARGYGCARAESSQVPAPSRAGAGPDRSRTGQPVGRRDRPRPLSASRAPATWATSTAPQATGAARRGRRSRGGGRAPGCGHCWPPGRRGGRPGRTVRGRG